MNSVRRSIIDRMRGAALLDIATYEEVEADTSATAQAGVVVALAAICAAVGAIGHEEFQPLGTLVSTLLGWLVWSGVTYLIGDKIFKGTATWGELLRTLGFAKTPYLFLVLGIIPVFGRLVWIAVAVWILIAGVVAIRQALDFSTQRAVLTALIAFVIEYTVFFALGVDHIRVGF